MTVYDDKKIQNLVKKLSKQSRPKTEAGKTYDKTTQPRPTDDEVVERDRFFKEMKKREF